MRKGLDGKFFKGVRGGGRVNLVAHLKKRHLYRTFCEIGEIVIKYVRLMCQSLSLFNVFYFI